MAGRSVAKKLVRRGRVRGYRPTRAQLLEILDLAQRGIEGDSKAHLTYSQGDLEIYPQGELKRVEPGDLDDIIREAGDPEELNNLTFSITQDSPVRMVSIEVGPGDWTYYQVESEDQTWAYGRYHELTEKFLNDRTPYAKFKSKSPQVLREGTDNWQAAAWEPASDWRIMLAGGLILTSWALLLIAVVYPAFIAAEAFTPPGKSKQSILDHSQALVQFHGFEAHSTALITLVVSYAVIHFALLRWSRGSLRSKVMLRSQSSLSRYSFRAANSDPVALGSFYVALFTLIIAVITLLIA